MTFTQELTCRWSTSTWTPTRLLTPARSSAQKLLHRNCFTGVQLTSRWSNCIWIPAKSDFSGSSISLWRQGQPGGGLRNVTLCGVLDTQMCVEMRVLFVLGQPSAKIARARWANMWYGEMRNFFARLRRSCVSGAQTCGGMWISFGHWQPSPDIATVGHPNMLQNANLLRPGAPSSHEMRANRQKSGVKSVILKVQMQAWHGSQTAITVGKLRFFNIRHQMQTFKTWCKIAILSILTHRAKKIVWNCDFPRSRTTLSCKMIVHRPAATLSHNMMAERQKLK